MNRRHSAPSVPSRLSPVKLDFNPLGRVSSPSASPVVKAKSAPVVMNKKTPLPTPRASRMPYHNSLIPTPLAPRKSPRKSPRGYPVKQEQLVLPVKAPASSSPKKPTNISPAKPKTPPLVIPTVEPKIKFSFLSRKRIHPVSNTETVPAAVAAVHIVPNKSLELPDKLLAIYYVGLIYEAIKGLAKEIKKLVEGVSKLIYIHPPIFDKEAVGKLERLIEDIERDTHIYHPTKMKKPLDIKLSYLFVKYLIKKPKDNEGFSEHMLEILRYHHSKLLEFLKKKHNHKLETLKRKGEPPLEITKMETELIKEYNNKETELDIKRRSYLVDIRYKEPKEFKKILETQNSGLVEDIIFNLKDISHKEFENKLQSLKDTMNEFLGIVNNILSADVEPSRTDNTLLLGGYILFPNLRYRYILFPNLRYNRDDKEFTPLVYRYIDANRKNFENVLEYFNRSFIYFKKINKRMVDRYAREHQNIFVKDEVHPEYNSNAVRYAISRYPNLTRHATIAADNTISGISIVEKQLKKNSKDVAVKLFQIRLITMNELINKVQEETDILYHKLV